MKINKEPINRIVIFEKNIKGDLYRCNICKINFSAIQPCIVCSAIMEKEKELGRRLNKKEFDDLTSGLLGRAG
jgi:hypothetical protein